jgi:polysaccharide export outer membrane protein
VFAAAVLAGGCASSSTTQKAPDPTPEASAPSERSAAYLIGPGDALNIFVWRNPEISISVPVRPDGTISSPLVEDMQAVGKTPTQLARDIEQVLRTYIRSPVVTVIVTSFVGAFSEQVRVAGQASTPRSLPYREGLTLLDVMIEVGGLTEFAAGNRAKIVRRAGGREEVIEIRLDDLLKEGDITANVAMRPGDIVVIPEAFF